MTSDITDLLAQLEAPGDFATRLLAPAEPLAIEVTGVGRLKFPITPRTAKKLREVARPSPFGLRDQTLHDPNVRNCWEIPATRVKIAQRQFKPILAQHLQRFRVQLGFPEGCELKATFDKLLVYEKGQFFTTHQDSEKNDDMVGTMVVILPSEYSGGTLTVEHRGRDQDLPSACQPGERAFAARFLRRLPPCGGPDQKRRSRSTHLSPVTRQPWQQCASSSSCRSRGALDSGCRYAFRNAGHKALFPF